MRENRAKKQLIAMLRSLTPGSILHLLAEILRESADLAGRQNDTTAQEQFTLAHASLIVTGMGIDALPSVSEPQQR